MKILEFIKKLQNLPDSKKKIVLWTIVGVLAVVMGFFWVRSAMSRLDEMGQNLSKIEFPKVDTSDMPQIPSLDSIATDPTADWKTYTNTEYGFEIKYPADWYVKEIKTGIIEGGFYFSPEKPDESETGGMIFTNQAVSISVMTSEQSLKDFADYYLNLSEAEKYQTEKVKIGGIDGLKVVISCEGVGCGNPEWFIKKDGKFYIFNPNLSDKINIFEQMISTFKFINK